ncbi:HTH-type transcriptional regulator SgrR (plasmid) [Photobacterium sp. GJ3]|uniref:HTH-type transcriptional regulator SgrR n=1 Tax=Photobacterium sp. GJ3 TaxID=2829502 RepID=UPI001B8CFC64|nr:HTH-type transcriptional regulator SgrR [Photobacterium sp. GJ3]QUJ70253.1 HTH-type transcriptional regulator SgrR [Photobacterium sp. GJ3]
MSGQRLKTQFQRLYTHFSGQDSDTNLQDISEILFCTRRNVRMVINKMVDKGWIEWEPAIGRGKQSRLVFQSTDTELQYHHARKLVADGKLEPALEALGNDANRLAQLIQEQLGLTTQKGRQIVRVPYYRAFTNLNPLRPLRRSEQHLVRQIFNGLTRMNEEKEEVEGDLAHHWESFTPRHWRFYLRPAVRFHDGSLLDSQDVLASLERLKSHRLFRHLETITSPFPNTIDIRLSHDDRRLPDLLTNIMAVIQPAMLDEAREAELFPVGTGPYKVVKNDKQRLILEAFDQYFGFRALIDVVEIWILTGVTACYLQPSTDKIATPVNEVPERLTLDEGCNYLLMNRVNGLASDPEWLAYFQSRLGPVPLLSRMHPGEIGEIRLINAYGLLPGWTDTNPLISPAPIPAKRMVTLAFPQHHPVYHEVARAIESVLAEDGLRLKVMEMSNTDVLMGKHAEKIDLWLNGMSMSHHRDDAFLAWFYSFDHISRVMPETEFEALDQQVVHWRAMASQPCPSHDIGSILVRSGQVIPLFHAWLGVNSAGPVQGMEPNSMGWFDFKSVWLKPGSTS